MDRTPLLRFADEVNRQVNSGKKWNQIAKETGLNRATLRKLADGKDVYMKFEQLSRVNDFLLKMGYSLANMFSTPGIMASIADHGKVTFIIGSRPDETRRRIDLSRWDIRALREVLHCLNLSERRSLFTIEDVIWRTQPETFFGRNGNVSDREAWYHIVSEAERSVICIGSPKACHASEVMLARMFGVEPFAKWPKRLPAPFYFVWPDRDKKSEGLKSAFSRHSSELDGVEGATSLLVRDLKKNNSTTCAFFDGKAHMVDRSGREWDTFALIAAQRRPENQLWLVIAGLTGPATFGAAKIIRDFAVELPIDPATRRSQVAWAVAKVHVKEERGSKYRKDERRVVGTPELGRPQFWSPLNAMDGS